MPAWDDKQYLMFADERTRAARELLGRVSLDSARLVVDLGCGPGNSTELLRSRWPTARVIGVDNSEEMLQRARSDWPGCEWIHSDVRQFRSDTPPDLLFANALLQWLPDHESLIPQLFD
jgi:trans-aconitate 2-methyltransferase